MAGWSSNKKEAGPLHAIKRGIASLFVCAVVLLPLILGVWQVKQTFFPTETRKATALAAMQVRAADKTQAPVAPWQQPYITVTFDDGWESVYTEAMPLLQKYGIPTTQYVLSGEKIEAEPGYMTYAQMERMHQAGHELACHSVDHPDLTTLGKDTLANQLTTCKSFLEEKFNIKVREFASPYGAINRTTTEAIKQVYRSSRNTAGDITTNGVDDQDVVVKTNFDRYNITAITIRRETTESQLKAAIDYATKHNGWLVLNYHQVETGDTRYGLDPATFETQLRTISEANARIVTMGQFLDAADKESKQ